LDELHRVEAVVVLVLVGDVNFFGVVLLGALDLYYRHRGCLDELYSLDLLGLGLQHVRDLL
jgi:hypothetical protein